MEHHYCVLPLITCIIQYGNHTSCTHADADADVIVICPQHITRIYKVLSSNPGLVLRCFSPLFTCHFVSHLLTIFALLFLIICTCD